VPLFCSLVETETLQSYSGGFSGKYFPLKRPFRQVKNERFQSSPRKPMQALPYELPPEGSPAARQLDAALPDSLKGLRAHLSLEAILRLVEAFGGGKVYIPGEKVRGSELAKAVGLEAAQALSALLPMGESIEVPKADRLKRLLRNLEIVKRSNEGENSKSLSRRFNITQRQVFSILSDFG
jgi:Mor family transcriptional regulator